MGYIRGRRKSSQKLAKRRTFIRGEGVSTVITKQASKKKKKEKKNELRSDRPCCNSLRARSSGEPDRKNLEHCYSDYAYYFSFQTLSFFFCVVRDFPFFFNGLLFPNNSRVHSFFFCQALKNQSQHSVCSVCCFLTTPECTVFFLPSSEKSKSTLPSLCGTLKPVLRFPFVSGGREGGLE